MTVKIIADSLGDIPADLAKKLDITIMSESSLKKDWLKPEEDEAWENL